MLQVFHGLKHYNWHLFQGLPAWARRIAAPSRTPAMRAKETAVTTAGAGGIWCVAQTTVETRGSLTTTTIAATQVIFF